MWNNQLELNIYLQVAISQLFLIFLEKSRGSLQLHCKKQAGLLVSQDSLDNVTLATTNQVGQLIGKLICV